MGDNEDCIRINKPVSEADVRARGEQAVRQGIATSFTVEEKDDHWLLCLEPVAAN